MGWYGRTWQESFWSKVQQAGGNVCWPWTAYVNQDGYGRFNQYGKFGYTKLTFAHRVAYEVTYGEITDPNMRVLHRCDNPPCCNPNHLFLGTQSENIWDAMKKGRIHKKMPPPTCHPEKKYHARNMCKPCYERNYHKQKELEHNGQ